MGLLFFLECLNDRVCSCRCGESDRLRAGSGAAGQARVGGFSGRYGTFSFPFPSAHLTELSCPFIETKHIKTTSWLEKLYYFLAISKL